MSKIPPVKADEPEAKSADPVSANLRALKDLFPDAFNERRVDFDTLRQLLGDAVDDGDERYGLNWSGKRRARRLALTPSMGTLLPAKADSVEWETTRNLMIEGDNLEVLKLLSKSYAGKVKLIYIDPPYNTGNDFVYPDDYTDSLGNYLRRTGQLGADGVRNTSNTENSGRYHSDWLSMMLPRLMLARSLLNDQGLILISIDDAEYANLTSVARAVFGDDGHVATFVRRRRMATGMRGTPLSPDHEYVLVLAKYPDRFVIHGFSRNLDDFPLEDDKGRYRSTDLSVGMGRTQRPNQYFPITNPRTGKEFWPSEERVWRFEPGSMAAQIEADNIIWPDDQSEGRMSRPRFKTRWDEEGGTNPVSTWVATRRAGDERGTSAGLNEEGTKEVRALMGEQVFDYPKPLSLVQMLVSVGSRDDDIVLDFFAGSGTTGHAVMAQNVSDGGTRRYILVQLPELLDPANRDQKTAADFCDSLGKPRTIAELTKERLRRAAAKIKSETSNSTTDLGFRVYRLAESNLKTWCPGADLEQDLLTSAENLVAGRTEEDLLVELLLKRGIDLTEPSKTREIAGRAVHAFGGGVLIVCLADVPAAEAESIADGIASWVLEMEPVSPAYIFFRDSGFANDNAKANVEAILRQRLKDRGRKDGQPLPDLLDQVRSI